jgi:putative cell wall-binding protein
MTDEDCGYWKMESEAEARALAETLCPTTAQQLEEVAHKMYEALKAYELLDEHPFAKQLGEVAHEMYEALKAYELLDEHRANQPEERNALSSEIKQLLSERDQLAAAWLMLRDYAKAEVKNWSDRNADRYWEANRFLQTIENWNLDPQLPSRKTPSDEI